MTEEQIARIESITARLLALVNQKPVKPGRVMQIKEATVELDATLHGNSHDDGQE